MKALFALFVPVLLMAVIFTACKKDDGTPSVPAVTTSTYTATLTPTGARTVTSATVTSGTATTGTSGTVISSTATSGTGNFRGILNTTSNSMSYTLTYSGLSSPIAGVYINQATSATAAGTRSVTLVAPASATGTSGTTTGTTTLTSGLVTSMNAAGQTYILIPTTRYPAGEIGGTISKQ